MKDEIRDHVDKNKLMRVSQHGFTKGKSCLTNLLEFYEGAYKQVDMENSVDVVYLDFAKAFDKVPHVRLMNKVRSFGIEGESSKMASTMAGGQKTACERK